jgi:hypothetical protein
MSYRDNTCPQKVVIFKFEGHAIVIQMDLQSTLSPNSKRDIYSGTTSRMHSTTKLTHSAMCDIPHMCRYVVARG